MYLGPQKLAEMMKPAHKALVLMLMGLVFIVGSHFIDGRRGQTLTWLLGAGLMIGGGVWIARWRSS